ncbi:thermonuclease family protein [uncultured Gemella sp.]|uniref:thermonuclease family protein n=1 Tax=uncultured Gemella sp. TaxID=254352 RepID=UPI0028D45569|nr:thermonuclease family protein [uncultured Gemella sp.]
MNKKVFIVFFILFISISLLIITIFNTHGENYKEATINSVLIKGDTTRYKVKFVKKIDGDTIVVNFNNKDLKIRYLLIDTPETVKPGVKVQRFGPEASELNGRLLNNAKTIEIEFDVYQKEDKYHRGLCYVYADGKSVQEELLAAGLAEIKYVKPPDVRYLERYKKAQNKAKSNKRNLWSNS